MRHNIRINSSDWGTPGEIVVTEHGEVAWAGPIDEIADAGDFDALFCHTDDEDSLRTLLARARVRVAA
jgi:hypothetical protein